MPTSQPSWDTFPGDRLDSLAGMTLPGDTGIRLPSAVPTAAWPPERRVRPDLPIATLNLKDFKDFADRSRRELSDCTSTIRLMSLSNR
jgi:hypothetical protein